LPKKATPMNDFSSPSSELSGAGSKKNAATEHQHGERANGRGNRQHSAARRTGGLQLEEDEAVKGQDEGQPEEELGQNAVTEDDDSEAVLRTTRVK
jgi:hypothetical protein